MNQWCPPPPCCPPPCPPPSGVDQAQACWDQSQQLEQLVTKVIQDLITNDPNLFRNLPGVVDGSSAPAGAVGEFQQFSSTFNIPTTWNFQQLITLGTLPPGDWNISAALNIASAVVGGILASLSPVPAGMSNIMQVGLGVYVTSAEAAMMSQTSLVSSVARGNFTVPTQMTFLVQTNWLLGGGVISPQAGTGRIQMTARRAR